MLCLGLSSGFKRCLEVWLNAAIWKPSTDNDHPFRSRATGIASLCVIGGLGLWNISVHFTSIEESAAGVFFVRFFFPWFVFCSIWSMTPCVCGFRTKWGKQSCNSFFFFFFVFNKPLSIFMASGAASWYLFNRSWLKRWAESNDNWDFTWSQRSTKCLLIGWQGFVSPDDRNKAGKE